MIETHGKLLISAFIAILIGVVLIQPIGDDIELAKIGSRTILNESVALTITTVSVVNETVTLSAADTPSTGTLANNYLTTLTALRNETGENLLGFCNMTLATGALSCNATNSTTCYADYTYNDHSTGQLSTDQDEWISFDACRNSTMIAILADTHCNVTLATGAVRTEYDNFTDDLAYIDYKYEPDTYVHSSAARVLLTQTRLFFAIAIILVGIGFAVASFKQSGVM